jgi:hypothetical protein
MANASEAGKDSTAAVDKAETTSASAPPAAPAEVVKAVEAPAPAVAAEKTADNSEQSLAPAAASKPTPKATPGAPSEAPSGDAGKLEEFLQTLGAAAADAKVGCAGWHDCTSSVALHPVE